MANVPPLMKKIFPVLALAVLLAGCESASHHPETHHHPAHHPATDPAQSSPTPKPSPAGSPGAA